jgi:hypothetical protein
MAYSRWSHSYWYTFWTTLPGTETKFKLPTKKLKRIQTFEICDIVPLFITYGELQDEGLGNILSRVKRHFKQTNPNQPPTEEHMRELMDYINKWEKDVDGHFKLRTFIWFEWCLPIRNKLNRLWKKH